MKIFLVITLLFSSISFAFEGTVNYSVSEYSNGKKIPATGKKVIAYFKDNIMVRLYIEFDKSRSVKLSDDFYFSHTKGIVTLVDKGNKKYTESYFDKSLSIEDKYKGHKIGKGPTIQGQDTTLYGFKNTASAKKIEIAYANALKVKPTPYLVASIGSMAWGIDPDTGAVAMKFDMILEDGIQKIIEVNSIESRPLKPVDYIPNLSNLEKR